MVNWSAVSNQSWLGKLLRLPLSLIPRSATVPILQGQLKGSKWIVGSSTHGCWLGSYEMALQTQFAQDVKPGQVVYDIGANVGFYSLLAARLVGPSGRVFSFEPLPSTVAYLKKHIELNRLTNVEVTEAAVGSAMGTAMLELGPSSATTRVSTEGSVSVQVVSIDAWRTARQGPGPQVVKIDVEGAEIQVLEGAKQTLQTFRPVIFLATHGKDLHQTCCRMLREWGYWLAPLQGSSLEASDEVLARPLPLA